MPTELLKCSKILRSILKTTPLQCLCCVKKTKIASMLNSYVLHLPKQYRYRFLLKKNPLEKKKKKRRLQRLYQKICCESGCKNSLPTFKTCIQIQQLCNISLVSAEKGPSESCYAIIKYLKLSVQIAAGPQTLSLCFFFFI